MDALPLVAIAHAAQALGGYFSDPKTLESLGLNVLGSEMHARLRSSYVWVRGLLGETPSSAPLPAQTQLIQSSRRALLSALRLYSCAVQNTLEPKPALVGAIRRHLQQGTLFDEPLIELRACPEREWLEEFDLLCRRSLESTSLALTFDHDALRDELLSDTASTDFQSAVHSRVAVWVERHLSDQPGRPAQFDALLRDGFAIDDTPVRLSLYAAWSVFFREEIRRQPATLETFVVRSLATLLTDGRRLAARLEDVTELFEARLAHWDARLMLPLARAQRADEPEVLTEAQRALIHEILTGGAELHELAKQVLRAPVRGLQGFLLHRYATRVVRDQLDGRDSFIAPDLYFDRVPRGGASSAQNSYATLQSLLIDVPDAAGWQLLGAPGSGKSTVLKQHELVTLRAALQALSQGNTPQEVALVVPLSQYEAADGGEPAEWLRGHLSRQYPAFGGAGQLQDLLPVRYLLDGVNEIRSLTLQQYQQAVRAWSQWMAASKPAHLSPIFSVRRAEPVEMLGEEGARVLEIQIGTWSAGQMWDYCQQVLPKEGERFWSRLRADRRLFDLCSLPFNLAAQCELFAGTGSTVGTRAHMLSGMVWLRLRRSKVLREPEIVTLLSELDLRQIDEPQFWRTHLISLPQDGDLIRALDEQAAAMQGAAGGVEVAVPVDHVLPQMSRERRAAWLRAVEHLGFARLEVNGQFRFQHQLWQEFFAARGMARQGPAMLDLSWPVAAAPEHESQQEPESAYALRDRVYEGAGAVRLPPRSTWEPVVTMAAQLAAQPEIWIDALKARDVSLAGRVAATVMERLPAADLDVLRHQLLARSRDGNVDVPLRLEAAEALGGVQDTLRYVEAARPGRDRCLLPSDDSRRWRQVGGHPFEMAFAPVTNAEFECFVAAGGYEAVEGGGPDARWWRDADANHWWHRAARDERRVRWWRSRLRALRRHGQAALDTLFPASAGWSPAQRVHIGALAAGTEQACEEWIRAHIEWDAKLRLPALAQHPRFGQPLQPVVGICYYEAQAYCHWLSEQTGERLRLPTRSEWQATTMHEDEPSPPAVKEIGFNCEEMHLRSTSAVGVFPAADRYGLTDLWGNVLEWTCGAVSEQGGGARHHWAMGGAWNLPRILCRPERAVELSADARLDYVGFRLVRALDE